MVEKRRELSTEKALSTVQPGTNPGQHGAKQQRAANGDSDVQAVQGLILNHVDQNQVLA